MRLLLDVKDNPHTGKGHFIKSLSLELADYGIQVVGKGKHDAYLAVNSFKHKTDAPKILRLNGVNMNTAINYKKANAEIKSSTKKADGIIYQSNFCREMHYKYVGKFDIPTAVIYNGSKRYKVSHGTFSPYVVVAARKRPHKRIREAKEAAYKAGIKILVCDGNVSHDKVMQALYECVALVHLAYLDWAPNIVAEALTMGCPVITNNIGGTKEVILDGCGEVLKLDNEYNMKPVNLEKPPKIDTDIVAGAIKRYALRPCRVTNNTHVNIKTIASQYASFIKRVVNENS